MLLFAIASLPYGYYQLLRLVIFVSGLFSAYNFYQSKNTRLVVAFSFTAFLFNPIAPVYLEKGTWILIDLAISFLFFYSIGQIQGKK